MLAQKSPRFKMAHQDMVVTYQKPRTRRYIHHLFYGLALASILYLWHQNQQLKYDDQNQNQKISAQAQTNQVLSELNLEKNAQAHLIQKITTLEDENKSLMAKLAFFDFDQHQARQAQADDVQIHNAALTQEKDAWVLRAWLAQPKMGAFQANKGVNVQVELKITYILNQQSYEMNLPKQAPTSQKNKYNLHLSAYALFTTDVHLPKNAQLTHAELYIQRAQKTPLVLTLLP